MKDKLYGIQFGRSGREIYHKDLFTVPEQVLDDVRLSTRVDCGIVHDEDVTLRKPIICQQELDEDQK